MSSFYTSCIDIFPHWVNRLEIIFKFTVLILPYLLHEWPLKQENLITCLLKSFNGFSLPLRCHPDSLLWSTYMMLGNCLLPSSRPHLPSLPQIYSRLHHTRQLTAFVRNIPIIKVVLPSRSLLWTPSLCGFFLLSAFTTHSPYGIVVAWLSCLSLHCQLLQGRD